MDSFIKADIFFFITTIAVVLVSIIFSVALIYIIGILRNVKYISEKAREEADLLSADIDDLREHVRDRGATMASTFDFLKNVVKRRMGSTSKKK
jgi:uncharacterized protein YoxC